MKKILIYLFLGAIIIILSVLNVNTEEAEAANITGQFGFAYDADTYDVNFESPRESHVYRDGEVIGITTIRVGVASYKHSANRLGYNYADAFLVEMTG